MIETTDSARSASHGKPKSVAFQSSESLFRFLNNNIQSLSPNRYSLYNLSINPSLLLSPFISLFTWPNTFLVGFKFNLIDHLWFSSNIPVLTLLLQQTDGYIASVSSNRFVSKMLLISIKEISPCIVISFFYCVRFLQMMFRLIEVSKSPLGKRYQIKQGDIAAETQGATGCKRA